jgi:TolA-binding protein
MSDQDNFASGFVIGAFVGGVIGGILGATLASRRASNQPAAELLRSSNLGDKRQQKDRKRPIQGASQPDIELARRGLEDKIAQLNDAIDEARQRLGSASVSQVGRNQQPPTVEDSFPRPLTEDV